MPNLKFVSLAILKSLPFSDQKFTGSRDPGHAPFCPLLTCGGWRPPRPEATPEKCFKNPIEHALCRCHFRGKLGKNRDTLIGYWPPTKGFFHFRFQTDATSLHGNDVVSDVIKNAVCKDGHLTKAFQKENMTLQVIAKRICEQKLESSIKSLSKKLIKSLLAGSGYRPA